MIPAFKVSEEKNRLLMERLRAASIFEKDVVEKFVRSSGRGGQKVNKTSTCVYLKHLPTGIEVKCMAGRSQSLNRFLAWRELAEKIEALSGKKTAKTHLIEKKQRQKARKKRRTAQKYGAIKKDNNKESDE